ncbi:hypothetical protein ACU61A_15950 [Pseudonocardia sichuanensis]
MDKDTKKVLAEAERQGFTVRITSKGHAQVRDADGRVVAVLAGTGSDVRGLRNAIAQLRRAGFVWPPKKGR